MNIKDLRSSEFGWKPIHTVKFYNASGKLLETYIYSSNTEIEALRNAYDEYFGASGSGGKIKKVIYNRKKRTYNIFLHTTEDPTIYLPVS